MVVTAVWAVLCATVLVHHEMWRDELQAWLIVRDSADLGTLLANLRHEGHPGLWHLLLFAVRALWDSPYAMQLLHLLIAGGTVYLVCAHAPFDRVQRLLFPFGYFPFYEHAVVSRSYALTALLLFASCAILRGRAHRRAGRAPGDAAGRRGGVLAVALPIVLLSNTNALGPILAAALVAYLLCDAAASRAAGTAPLCSPVELGVLVPAALAGSLLSIAQIFPPAGTGFGAARELVPTVGRLGPAATAWVGAFFPLGEMRLGAWGDVRWDGLGWVPPGIAVAALALGFGLTWRRHAASRAFLLVATAGMLGLFGGFIEGSLRHHGFLYLAFVAALWLSGDVDWRAPSTAAGSGVSRRTGDRVLRAGVTVLFAIHLWPAATAALLDLRHPFSNGQAVAAWMRAAGLEEAPVVAYPSPQATSILGYLPAREFRFPQIGQSGSFTRWNLSIGRELSDGQLVCAALGHAREVRGDVLLIVAEPLRGVDPDAAIERVKAFPPTIIGDERYEVHRVRWGSDVGPGRSCR